MGIKTRLARLARAVSERETKHSPESRGCPSCADSPMLLRSISFEEYMAGLRPEPAVCQSCGKEQASVVAVTVESREQARKMIEKLGDDSLRSG
jgi:hypothetical protein